MPTNIFKEKYLLFRAKNKDSEAFARVYDFYVDRIYRFVFFKINRPDEAQDITSEVFLKTWQYIIDGKKINNLNALFYKIARNLVIDHYRKASAQDVSLENIKADAEEIKELADEQINKIDKKIQVEKIEEKLRGLKDDYREIIILRYIEDLSIGQIAEIVEKKKGAVRVILYRALNALKDLMGEADKK
ncbi:MAG: RNA polymerase sigma factor [Patescibacteria group bacterium]